ncbi:hypothetical protein B0J15DRAFT_143082 [Fusarium solani]|uniref:Uncharacterized protein n=1 Tax=Fusarium solani TaxID=169388 RepID=A0A9P9GH29_FUSSL|nr:uncharacterized protein B0J15DRAFT_143082 [Fusarium solani]KAH7237832.1 hypothetical protein B0J15DRAFT_143082 [Fusarium solani]
MVVASGHSALYFDRKLSTRVNSDSGDFGVNFQPNPEDRLGTRNAEHDDNKVSMDNNNESAIYNSGGDAGRFALNTGFEFGLKVDPGLLSDLSLFEVPIIDISMQYRKFLMWSFFLSPNLAAAKCLSTTVTQVPSSIP